MFPASSSNSYFQRDSQQPAYKTQDEQSRGRYRGIDEPLAENHPQSSPMSRQRVLYHSTSPSRHAYHHHSRSFHSDRSSPYSSPKSGYSYSPYARRPSSPLTSSSSPPPATSPLMTSLRFGNNNSRYMPNVKIVGRDPEESYLPYDSEYDHLRPQYSDNSRYYRSSEDEDLSKPKLPSFRSLFGSNEHVQHSRSNWIRIQSDPFSLPTFSPIPRNVALAPLNLPSSPIRTERKTRSLYDSASPVSTTMETCVDAGDHNEIPDDYNPALSHRPNRTVHSHFDNTLPQTPIRQKLLFSDVVSAPQTPDGVEFFSPSKVSPYPRRTYFLESSERGQSTPCPKPTNKHSGLYHLAEIADLVRSDLPTVDILKEAPDHAREGSSLDSSLSGSSSPVVYQSSLPPSSPPTSEAQLSPLVNMRDLSAPEAVPLADVMNLTPESRNGVDCSGVQLLKPTLACIDNDAENSHTTSVAFSAPVQVPTNAADAYDDTLSGGLYAVTPNEGVGSKFASEVMVLLDTSDHLQVSSDSCPSENLASSSDITSALLLHNDPVEPAIIDCVQTTQDLDESEPSLPKDDQLSLPEQSSSTSDAVSVPPSCDEPKVPVSPSSTSITTKPILGKTKSKPKSSLASSITSSKPRVTVNVVTRMRPIPNGQRNGAGTSAKVKESLGREKDRETLKARTSGVVNSHASKRFRESDGDAKETKVSEIPPKKKVRVTDEATEKVRSKPSLSPLSDFSLSLKSSSSSLSDLTSSSSEFTSETSLRAVRRKRKASSPSPPNKPPLIPQKKRKVVFVELPILPKRKLEIAPPDDIPPPDESNDPSWVDEGWVDALAAAYGSPASRKSNAPHPQTTPIRKRSRKQPVAKPLFELDSSSDDLEDEDRTSSRSVAKQMVDPDDSDAESKMMKISPNRRRGVVYSDSEDDDSEVGEDVGSKRRGSSLSALTSSEDEEEEDDTSSESERSSSVLPKHSSKSQSHFPPPSDLDIEVIGIIIEAMSLSRASSHLASALYRTVCDTRGGIFAKLIQANPAHFHAVTDNVRSKGLVSATATSTTDNTLRRGRPKRGTATNDEGGVAGMSEADIVWVSEFERIMIESAERCGMFGMVESSFRNDPRALPPPFSSRFFYVPDKDPDTERASLIQLTMPGAGKRSETKKYKQYYWKPVGK